MPDEALQTAFEIKTTCDEISRKLLRWHWENKPGEHSLGALLDHIRTRQQESPEYYDRLPDLAGRNSWQQLDTTLCMRVLLDPEKDAAHQLDLLGNTEHPAAARRAAPARQPEPEVEQYDEEDDAEESRDGIAETLVRWVPPITAIVCAGIALWGFVYYQFMM